MKIGILTYHRTLNYGACLQAVATRVILEQIGHKVYYVDYWPKYHASKYKPFSWTKFMLYDAKGKVKYLYNSLKTYKYKQQRIDNFTFFFNKYIIPYCKPLSETYDIVVYGSDQIWRKQKETNKYNPIYFAKNNIKACKHIAYAASMGILPQSDEDCNLIRELVSNFDKISVREFDLKEKLYELGYNNVFLSLDPTLLLSCVEWDNIIPTDLYNGPKYVLVYGMGKTCFSMDEVYKYAISRGCVVKVLYSEGVAPNTESFITTANPYDFIKLIKNAECIFTSSFHGLAFSIIYKREFFSSYITNSNRAATLLKSVGIEGRMLRPNSKIPDAPSIDYNYVAEKLDKYINESKKYLLSI